MEDKKDLKVIKKRNISKESIITVILSTLIIIALIDILLVMKLININDSDIESKKSIQTSINNDNQNGKFEFLGYKFEISPDYVVNVEEELCTIKNNNLKGVITINEGTMENIENNLGLLKNPINDQGGKIIVEPNLQTVNNKDIYVIEYQLEEKNYVIGYTELDENNIIDIIAEKTESDRALELLVKISNNATKIEI